MQKKLIAAAVAALVSTGAMADATTYGIIDIGYGSVSNDNGAGTKTTTTDTGTMSQLSTSRLGWNVSEDLGGGLGAFGNLELAINNVASTANTSSDSDIAGTVNVFGIRTAFLGLKSDAAGSLTLGRQTVLVDTVMGVGSVGGLNNIDGNAYRNLGKENNTRSSSLIAYSSPNFGGVTFAVAVGQAESEANNTSHDEFGLKVQYSGGPLTVALGYNSEEASPALGGAATDESTQLALAANYDLGVAKLYGLYMDGDDKANNITGVDGFEFGVKFPLGAVNLFASIYQGETDNTVAADVDHSGFQLGALYSLSKRTTAYAVYGSAEAENATTKVAGEKTHLALGIRHSF